jgi:hypothetical protein
MAAHAVKNPELFEPADFMHRMFFTASSPGLGMNCHF